eukprot:7015671-Prymnesium_polylepis.1
MRRWSPGGGRSGCASPMRSLMSSTLLASGTVIRRSLSTRLDGSFTTRVKDSAHSAVASSAWCPAICELAEVAGFYI